MHVHDVVRPPLDPRAHQVLGRVVVDGDDRQILQQDALCLLHEPRPDLQVGFPLRLAHEDIVLGVDVACRVHGADVALEQLEKGVGVVVVADPAGPVHVELLGAPGGQVNLPFLVEKLRLDAESLFPHARDGDGDALVVVAGVVQDLHLQRVVPGISGLGVELPGPGQPLGLGEARPRHLRAGVLVDARRHPGICGDLAALGDFPGEDFPVDGHGQRVAKPRPVAERRLGEVQGIVVGAEICGVVELRREVLLHPCDLIAG